VKIVQRDQPITISEVARILQCAEDTARRMADIGVLEVSRTSTGVRIFSREQVERVARDRASRASLRRGEASGRGQ